MIVQLCSAHYKCLTFQHPQSQRGSVTLREDPEEDTPTLCKMVKDFGQQDELMDGQTGSPHTPAPLRPLQNSKSNFV